MRKLAFLLAAAALLTANAQSTTFEDAKTAVANMGPGWNIGNTLDSHSGDYDNKRPERQVTDNHMKIEYGQNGEKWDSANGVTTATVNDYETAWGQGRITPELIHMFREAGFTTIRVPVTWYPHMGKMNLTYTNNMLQWDKTWVPNGNDTYKVHKAWMDRVKEVVDMILAEGMYCILNTHHDSGPAPTAWIEANGTKYNNTEAAYISLWTQIANEFKNYDEHLIFEAYNEIMDVYKSWCYASMNKNLDNNSTYDGTIAADAYAAVNNYAQTFVNTVRNTGGNNAQRNLVVTTYVAECEKDHWRDENSEPLTKMKLPTHASDPQNQHIIFEVHMYPPTSGKSVDDVNTYFNTVLGRIKAGLLTNDPNMGDRRNIPVIFGEWGASEQDKYEHNECVLEGFATYFTSKLKEEGMAAMLWRMLADDDNSDNQGKGSRDPKNLQWGREGLKNAIITGYYGAAGYTVKDCYVDINNGTTTTSWVGKPASGSGESWTTAFTIDNADNSSINSGTIALTDQTITVNCAPGYSFSSVKLTTNSNATINGVEKTPNNGSISSNFAAGANSFTLSGGDITAVNFRLTPDLNYYKKSNGKFGVALTSDANEVLHENYLYNNNGSNWTATQITLYDDIDYTLDKQVTAAAFNYNRTLLDEAHTQGYWQPLFLPVSVPKREWQKFAKSVYYFSGANGDELVWTKVTDDLSANTPYIFMPNADKSANIALAFKNATTVIRKAEVTQTYGKYTIHGNYATKNDMCSTGAYALWDGAFMQAASNDAILKPYRLYLTVNNTNGNGAPERVSIKVIDPEETGIEELLEETVQPTDDIYYDLMGRRVMHPTTGIYIHNGKKVYIR